VLDAIKLPPRLLRQALADLHDLAGGVRRLTERGGDLEDLMASVQVLPKVEDELSANIASLRDDVSALREELATVEREIHELNDQLHHVRDRLPGI
jgi:septal ring factor EnvC (AmiA/AmiB activator)